MKFEMIIPTYKRIDKLKRLLDSIHPDYLKFIDVYIYCDNNDIDTYNALTGKYGFVMGKIMDKQYRAFGIWNYHLKNHFNSDAMIYVCDDIEFMENALMGMYLLWEQINNDNDIVIGFNQYNLESSSKYAMGIIGKNFLKRFPNNQYFCPDYVSFYADSESGEYAESLGKFYFGNGLKIHHYHPAFYKNENDEAHKIVRDKHSQLDKIVNKKRKQLGLLWGQNFDLIRPTIEGV